MPDDQVAADLCMTVNVIWRYRGRERPVMKAHDAAATLPESQPLGSEETGLQA